MKRGEEGGIGLGWGGLEMGALIRVKRGEEGGIGLGWGGLEMGGID